MIWYYAEDVEHFDRYSQVRKEHKDLYVNPTLDVINKSIYAGNVPVVLASYMPPEEVKGLYVVKELPNKYGAFTTQEMQMMKENCPEEDEDCLKKQKAKLAKEKLGLDIFVPEIKLSDVGGMKALKEYLNVVIANQDDPDLRIKAVMLVGLPGTGKSFTAKAFAGELGRLLVFLNLSVILESDFPARTLHKAFTYLQELNEPVVLWIDEIEKMFTGTDPNETRLIGQMLTILNDLNTPEGYKIDAIIWVTANNIVKIIESYPEFLRKGRFDELFFVNNPKYDSTRPADSEAREIFEIYVNKYLRKKGIEVSPETLLEAMAGAVSFWRKNKEASKVMDTDITRYVYTPAEIETLIKDVARRVKAEGKTRLTAEDFMPSIRTIRPIFVNMPTAITKMRAQKEMFVEV